VRSPLVFTATGKRETTIVLEIRLEDDWVTSSSANASEFLGNISGEFIKGDDDESIMSSK
jgi:hypothetical protein